MDSQQKSSQQLVLMTELSWTVNRKHHNSWYLWLSCHGQSTEIITTVGTFDWAVMDREQKPSQQLVLLTELSWTVNRKHHNSWYLWLSCHGQGTENITTVGTFDWAVMDREQKTSQQLVLLTELSWTENRKHHNNWCFWLSCHRHGTESNTTVRKLESKTKGTKKKKEIFFVHLWYQQISPWTSRTRRLFTIFNNEIDGERRVRTILTVCGLMLKLRAFLNDSQWIK